VDKNRFTALLKEYTQTSAEEAQRIIALRDAYPYAQLLHAIAARSSKDNAMPEHQSLLSMAAIYAADRSVLKEIMTFVAQARPVEEVETVTVAPSEEPQPATGIRSIETSEIDYADEVMRDLQTLNELKHNFEMLLVEYSEVQVSPLPDTRVAPSDEHAGKDEPKEQTTQKDKPTPQQGVAKSKSPQSAKKTSKRQRIIELAKALNKTPQPTTRQKKKEAPVDPPDALIEDIKTSKQELRPENEKQLEQLTIIDRFIQTQPSISNAKERTPPPAGDLNPIKSGEFGDNIVSETLVEILIKQGKKDKAIEVLKKLIWKYPQKKAYFASQIEDLKK